MKNYLLRRRGYGNNSCLGIMAAMLEQDENADIGIVRSDKGIPETDGYVFRWGTTSTIPGNNHIVVNSAESIHRVFDKKKFRLLCNVEGIAPKSWGTIGDYLSFEFVDGVDSYKDVIVRKNFHKQGKNLHRCKNAQEVSEACNQYDDYYISEYIPKVAEYRVLIVSGRVIYMYEKVPENPEDVAWNHAQGGSMDNVKWSRWPLGVVNTSVKAFELSKLDFGAVDIMVDGEGRSYVLEINTAPETTSPYRQGCFAKAFNYILKNGKNHIPVGKSGTWKSYIHPAVSNFAEI